MKRSRVFTLAAIAGVLAAFAPRPASSDDMATVRALIKAATANVHSFRMQISSPIGMTGVMTVVREPLKMHMQMATGPITMDAYVAGGYFYSRLGTSEWKKQLLPLSAVNADAVRALTDSTHMTLGPDVTEDGVGYGSYEIQIDTAMIPGAPPPPAMTMTCTYDKKTYLVHDCTNAFFTQTLVGYNDPGNDVTLPAELATAADAIALPAAVPAPTAQPK